MADKRSLKQMQDLRDRLYARGEELKPYRRESLRQNSGSMPPVDGLSAKPAPAAPPPPSPPSSPLVVEYADYERRPGRAYRKILIITAAVFFVLSVLASTAYVMLGRNTVSGNNIAISTTGPFTVGGGDVVNLQIGITNQNAVPIESASVLVEYPPGTRSADDAGRDLPSERIALDSGISTGETRNIPLKARVFGSENQEGEVRVSIEYRVVGSSATFYKEAAPYRFKINHAPVTLKVAAEKTISSGQETTVKLTVTSNAPSTINDLLVRAEYPSGFEFSRANPAPMSGRNVWRISELKPEESATIDITGVISGTKSEKYVLKFSAGLGGEKDPNNLSSVLAAGDTEFALEDPFLDLKVTMDNNSSETISVAPGAQPIISIDIQNTLLTPVYDGVVEVRLSGNALSDAGVTVNNGYYDSNNRMIRFNSSSVPGLARINAGKSEHLSFSLKPSSSGVEAPEIVIDVSASARRVSESSAREQIAGTHHRVIRVESRPTIAMAVARVTDGPVPPVVGQTTTYDVRWTITNAANSVSGTTVTAALPPYVEWLNETSGDGVWSYNSSARTIEWRVGSIPAGRGASGAFRVSFLPSTSLVGRTPTLIESAQLQSSDDFTGTLLRSSAPTLTTDIIGERGSGNVQAD